jgi:BMFP domain-containing protein YqiC
MAAIQAPRSTSSLITSLAQTAPAREIEEQVRNHLDTEFNDLDYLLGYGAGNRSATAGPSRKKRRTLDQEILYWEKQESSASAEVRPFSPLLQLQVTSL